MHTTSLLCWGHLACITLIWGYTLCLHQAPVPPCTAALRTEFSHSAEQTSKLVCAQGCDRTASLCGTFEFKQYQRFLSATQWAPSTTSRQPSINHLTVVTFHIQCSVIFYCIFSGSISLTFVFVPNSGADTDIIVPISVLSSLAALVSFVVTGSGLLTEVGDGFSCPSGSPCWASFTFLFFKERSLPIGPGLYSLFSTGLKSGS